MIGTEHNEIEQPKPELLSKFKRANEHRDYSIYTWLMDAALHAKALMIIPFFGELSEKAVVVDCGSGTGKLAELVAQLFRGIKVKALDISHELLELTKENQSFIDLVYGNAENQNFPPNSVDVMYFSTSLHEVVSFGGSLKKTIENALIQLKAGGKLVIRDFVLPSIEGDVYLELPTGDGLELAEVDAENLDYNSLSTKALFECFHREFRGGQAFTYEEVEWQGKRLYKLPAGWAYEFYMRKDYTGNWRQEIKEKYGYWTLEQAQKTLSDLGFGSIEWEAERNEYIYENRLKNQISLYQKAGDTLQELEIPPTHLTIAGTKPHFISENNQEYPLWEVPVDYEHQLSRIRYELGQDVGKVYIDDEVFAVKLPYKVGTKKHIFELVDQPGKLLKVVRPDTLNAHAVFKSMYQIVERQEVLRDFSVPHLPVTEVDGKYPPYAYVIQESAPEGSVSAAELIMENQLTEIDIKQMAQIVSKFENSKEWQLDMNPFSWFKIVQPDGSTQMTYVSGKVYRFDERWSFVKIGLPQWLDQEYIRNAENLSAVIPTLKQRSDFAHQWSAGGGMIDTWKKYFTYTYDNQP